MKPFVWRWESLAILFWGRPKGLRRIKGGCIEHSALVRGIDGEEILRVEDIIAVALPKAWAVWGPFKRGSIFANSKTQTAGSEINMYYFWAPEKSNVTTYADRCLSLWQCSWGTRKEAESMNNWIRPISTFRMLRCCMHFLSPFYRSLPNWMLWRRYRLASE